MFVILYFLLHSTSSTSFIWTHFQFYRHPHKRIAPTHQYSTHTLQQSINNTLPLIHTIVRLAEKKAFLRLPYVVVDADDERWSFNEKYSNIESNKLFRQNYWWIDRDVECNGHNGDEDDDDDGNEKKVVFLSFRSWRLVQHTHIHITRPRYTRAVRNLKLCISSFATAAVQCPMKMSI